MSGYIFFMVQRQICIIRQTSRNHKFHKKIKLLSLVCRFNCKSYWHIFHFLSVRKIQFWFWEVLLCRIWGFLIFRWFQKMLHVKSENEARIWSRKRWAIAALSYFKSLWIHRKTNQAHSNKKKQERFQSAIWPSSKVCICTQSLVSIILSSSCYWTTFQHKPRTLKKKCSNMVKQWKKTEEWK